MKVILQHDVPKLGKVGDIVNVADGFARNYLFPRQYAVPASGGYLKQHQARLAYEQERGGKLHAEAEAAAQRLADTTIIVTGKVGSGTKLYGSITAQDVAEAIKQQTGVDVDKRRVGLINPIKTLGEYRIPVRLGADVTVQVAVEVTTEEELQRRSQESAAPASAEAEQAEASE